MSFRNNLKKSFDKFIKEGEYDVITDTIQNAVRSKMKVRRINNKLFRRKLLNHLRLYEHKGAYNSFGIDLKNLMVL